jgi:hypothetical protein
MPLHFRKQFISEERYESAGVFDVDGDGHLDIVSGAYWYPGPDFRTKCPVGDVMPAGEYYDDFSTIPLDINGDGFPDFVTGGWFGAALQWRENPKGQRDQNWELHEIEKTGNVETTRAWDLDGDGMIEIVPNCPGESVVAFKLITDKNGRGTGKFSRHVLWEGEQGHGLGCGDIAGNGRPDLVLRHGWLECPERPLEEPWTLHSEFELGSSSVPIIVADVNGDGLADIIVGQAHDYGLHWWEQGRDGDKRTWTRHVIDPFNSQYHDMQWVDIDGDGECELVTGIRYRAHCGGDPGANEPVGIYYFKWTGESFSKQVVDHGSPGEGTGVGIHFDIADLTGDGRLDIIAPGKDGLWVFFNEGQR